MGLLGYLFGGREGGSSAQEAAAAEMAAKKAAAEGHHNAKMLEAQGTPQEQAAARAAERQAAARTQEIPVVSIAGAQLSKEVRRGATPARTLDLGAIRTAEEATQRTAQARATANESAAHAAGAGFSEHNSGGRRAGDRVTMPAFNPDQHPPSTT